MSRAEIKQTLDAIQQAGVVIVGRGHIEALATKHARQPAEVIPTVLMTGRARGIYFYQDPSKFNGLDFARMLGELGFNKEATQVVLVNILPTHEPERTSSVDID